MQYRLNTKKPHLLCLILLISFPSVCTVFISPALPAISNFFGVSSGYTQQLITIFVIGYAVGQLLYPPFANRFGRKIAVYLGLLLYLFSCFICLIGLKIHSLETIFLGRFLMALGSSVGMIISFTIINDFYHPTQARSVVGYTVLAYAFMPALAIACGGLITSHFSWRDCFYCYVVYGIFILAVSMRLPETLHTKNFHALKIKMQLRNYYHAFGTWRLVLFSIIYGLMSSFIYVIAGGAPFIGVDTIGLTPSAYGLLLLVPYSGQFIGALSAGKFSHRFSAYQVIAIGYSCVLFGSLMMLICFLLNWMNVFSLMAPLFFIMMGLPLTYSSVTVMAMTGYEDKATGSAVMGFITMSIALLATFVTTVLPNKNPLMMPIVFAGILVLAIAAFWHAVKRFGV